MAKTTVKVRAKKWELFNKECKAASIRRDDFLDRALPDEIDLLKTISPCDDVGELWLKSNWVVQDSDDIELHPVPLLLSDEVVEALNAASAEKRIPRDAFLDCALSYFTARLHEAVIVIRKPRTSADLVARIAETLNPPNDLLDEADQNRYIVEDARECVTEWKLERFAEGFYASQLSIDSRKVEREKLRIDLLGDITPEQVDQAKSILAFAKAKREQTK